MSNTNKGNNKRQFKIWCETQKEVDAVLKRLEEQGILWCSNNKPTELTRKAPVGFYVDGRWLSYDTRKFFFDGHRYCEITSCDYLNHKNECIVIYRKGQEVIALDKTTGKKAVAKCSPEDEFDFNIGSKLAFERLLGTEQPQYKEVKRKAKKGEYVKIVKPFCTGYAYGKNDILKVIKKVHCGVYCTGANISCPLGYFVEEKEYVVLEGYEPPKEEKKNVTFRALCIKDCTNFCGRKSFLKGKVYEWVDGCCTREDGAESCVYKSFNEMLERNVSYRDCLIELKDGDDPDEIMKQYTFFNGKAVYKGGVDYFGEGYTIGKIYEFKDGFCIDDDGIQRPMAEAYKKLPNVFIEIVE